jgi:putative phosphoribosyl transferase
VQAAAFLPRNAPLRDAFLAARRRLEDHVRRMRGAEKPHAPRAQGRIAQIFLLQGYGFIETPDGREVYFHRNSLSDLEFKAADVGSTVFFSAEEGGEGPAGGGRAPDPPPCPRLARRGCRRGPIMTVSHAVESFDVAIPINGSRAAAFTLPGRLCLPAPPTGLVLFAHGSGSSRLSPRNAFVAEVIHEAWIGTLLFDLLTEQEATDRVNVFDVPFLSERLLAAIRFVTELEQTRHLPLGLFGASTGAAAALLAAARDPRVAAVVSRGGRPDLAGRRLAAVHAPTLLIVGGDDTQVLALNQQALGELAGVKRLAVIPGATHLFEEPGTLEEAAQLAAEWFARHLHP